MKIISIKIKTYLLTDIPYINALSAVAVFIDKALCKSPQWASLHKENKYKGYAFSNLAPTSKSGIYSKDTLCTFTLRTLDPELAKYLADELPHTETSQMKGLINEVWEIRQRPIEKLYTLTPLLIRTENGGYWKGTIPFDKFQQAIFVNLVKKYNYFQKTKLDENFQLWDNFQLTNEKPLVIPYKGIKLLGDKLEIHVADNQAAQNLAYMALATGLGVSNPRGCGYVNYRTVKGV